MYYLDYDLYKEFDSSPSTLYKGGETPAFLSELNIKWFDEVKDRHIYHLDKGKKYYPVTVCVSIRSMFSNLVLCNEVGECYTLIQLHDIVPHREEDLIMYETAQIIRRKLLSDLQEERLIALDDVMMHSVFQYAGFTVTSKYPVFYSHIILAEEYVDKFSDLLHEEYKFIPIQNIPNGRRNPSVLRDSLVIVKGESNERTDDNN